MFRDENNRAFCVQTAILSNICLVLSLLACRFVADAGCERQTADFLARIIHELSAAPQDTLANCRRGRRPRARVWTFLQRPCSGRSRRNPVAAVYRCLQTAADRRRRPRRRYYFNDTRHWHAGRCYHEIHCRVSTAGGPSIAKSVVARASGQKGR